MLSLDKTQVRRAEVDPINVKSCKVIGFVYLTYLINRIIISVYFFRAVMLKCF